MQIISTSSWTNWMEILCYVAVVERYTLDIVYLDGYGVEYYARSMSLKTTKLKYL